MKAQITGMEFRLALEDAGHKICSALGLNPVSYVWQTHASTAGISAKGEIVFPNIDDGEIVNRSLFDRYSGYLLHELLHRKYTNFFVGRNSPSYLRNLHNAVEDVWIERKCIADGLTGNSEPLLTDLINGIIDETLSNPHLDWTAPGMYPFALACYGRRYAKAVPIADGLEPIFAEASRRIDQSNGTADNLLIAEWVMAQLMNLEDQPEDQPDDQQGEGEGEGGQDASETDQNGSGGDKKASQGDDKGDGKESPGKARKPKGANEASKNPEISLARNSTRTGTFDRNAGLTDIREHIKHLSNIPIATVPSGKLAYEVKRLFDKTGREDFLPNLRRGKLNTSALHRLTSGDDRVFKRRREVSGIESAVTVVLDISGSMEPILPTVVSTAYALIDTLEKAGVKTSVLTFGSDVAVLKPFDSHSIKRHRDQLERLGDAGGTNDYYAIRIAHEMLARRDEARKVCFVLTDGMGDVKSACAQIENGEKIGITTIGIGILDDVSAVYRKSVKIESLNDLASTSFKQIKLAV